MSLISQCPGCHKFYAVNEKYAGRTLTCKQCGGPIPVKPPDDAREDAPRVRVECADCGKGHWVSAENAGRKTICKKCGALFASPAVFRGRPE